MKIVWTILLATLFTSTGYGQVLPTPDPNNPRVQSAEWAEGQPVILTALPESTLTVILEPTENVNRATLSGSQAWNVSVTSERNSLQITPQAGALPASLSVETDQRSYQLELEVDQGLMAAYLVELRSGPKTLSQASDVIEPIHNLNWGYRLRGDRDVRPQSIRDNGEKTVITYAPDQSLPAVFAIGPTGDEEVVNGYMRGDIFVIDRVHSELVFRINKDKATARRNKREDAEQ